MDWIDPAQHADKWQALENAVMKLQFPWNAWNLSS
jgi:hypothetical protein